MVTVNVKVDELTFKIYIEIEEKKKIKKANAY